LSRLPLWFALTATLVACTDSTNGLACLASVELDQDLDVGIAPFKSHDPTTEALALRFRQSPGFYTAPFSLAIEGADAPAQIIYTLDGSLPDRAAIEDASAPSTCDEAIRRHTYRYSGPVDLAPWLSRPNQLSLVDTGTVAGERGWRKLHRPVKAIAKSVVVRAQAFSGDVVSPVLSGTFLVDPQGRERYELPVISLSTEPASLFNRRVGIYVAGDDISTPNFLQRGDDWERPAYFELFDERGERPLAQWLGVRIHGNFTRAFPQKSLRLLARKEYGPSALEYPFFASKPNAEFKRLVLRNGGNDWGQTYFRDAAIQALVQHLPLETQHAQAAVVFINGEYWGLHHIRDNLDAFHLELHHGVPRDRLTILEKEGWLVEGREADAQAYRDFIAALTAGSFDTWEAVDRHVAVSEFLDYAILESYAGNTDWLHNNFEYWRFSGPDFSSEHGPRDGRFRPLVFDLDNSLGRAGSTESNVLLLAFSDESDRVAAKLFRGMIALAAIRHEFIQRMAIHLATTFEPRRVSEVVDEFTRSIEHEMPAQIARWGHPKSMNEFYQHVEGCHEFAEARPRNVRRHMISFFKEVKGLATVRIENIDAARPPTLHGVRLSSETPGVTVQNGSWQATVFAGVPLVLTSDDPHLSVSLVNGATAKGMPGRLEVTLDADTVVTIRLPVPSSTGSLTAAPNGTDDDDAE
jgi:hypothetical protein